MDGETDRFGELERLSDRELIRAARNNPGARAERFLGELYRRHYRRVAHWCVRIGGNREEAADLAQEVFLRAHSRLDSFRLESAFSTWLYTVARSVVINRGKAARSRPVDRAGDLEGAEPVDPSPDASEILGRTETLDRVREVMQSSLDPLEAKVLYLHHAGGMTLPAITKRLSLQNKSGAKAYIVSGMRKLKRHFGRGTGSSVTDPEGT